MDNAINFYKTISIIGGSMPLYAAGPRRYAFCAMHGARLAASARAI
ncbi:MAG TPA: hypothetical protein VMU81_08550 [Acetobacteraceae bacterium]|nr:hypothetical protein [Acetobacteraceae bacterium]